jgi:predicted lipid-binding transport protein (Tim44 family)
MNRFFTAACVIALSAALMPTLADAKRLGGGGASGMQRSMPARTAPDALPAKPAAPAAAPTGVPANAAAAAAAPKRSWMGPVAGLAAGLGIAALMSHLGMGAEFGNFLTMLLIGIVAIVAIRFVMRRLAAGRQAAGAGGMQFAGAAAHGGSMPMQMPQAASGVASGPAAWNNVAAPATSASAAQSVALPAGFDRAAFERIAKMIFIRMQAANDAGDLNDLRNFTTPEMFASAKLDLQERGASTQRTDVVKIDAEVLEFAEEAQRQIVSVRFHGLIREEEGGGANEFDEVWHLVKPTDGSREWAIAGIQQTA